MKNKIYKRLIPTLMISVFLSACAQQGRVSPASNDPVLIKKETVRQVRLGRAVDKPLTLIAEDMVSALSQVGQVRASGLVVRMPDAKSRFDLAVERTLIKKGFTIKNARNNAGGNLLRTAVNRGSNSNEYTHVIALDQLGLKRSYVIDGKLVAPTSSLFVRGVSPAKIVLDDRVFVAENNLVNSSVVSNSKPTRIAAKPVLCTPEGKGRDTDGWICNEGITGKQWIDVTQHNVLLDAGMEVNIVNWDRLMDLPDVVVMSDQQIFAASAKLGQRLGAGSLYLCTPDGKGVGTDGWLCREGESGKQWISAAERKGLVRSGTPERRVGWDSLMAMNDREFIR